MFSPAKTITAAALVFAVTGAFLVAQPLGLPGTSAPGAEIDVEPAEPIEVSGRWMGYDCEVGPHYCTQAWSMSDPRLDGTVKWFSTEWKDPDFNPVTFGYTSYAIENDGGSWRGLTDAWVRLPGTGDSGTETRNRLV